MTYEDTQRAKSLHATIKKIGYGFGGNNAKIAVACIITVVSIVLIVFMIVKNYMFLMIPAALSIFCFVTLIADSLFKCQLGEKCMYNTFNNELYKNMNMISVLSSMPYSANDLNRVKYLRWRKRTIFINAVCIVIIIVQAIMERHGLLMVSAINTGMLLIFTLVNILVLIAMIVKSDGFKIAVDCIYNVMDTTFFVMFIIDVFDDESFITVLAEALNVEAFSMTAFITQIMIIVIPLLLTCFFTEKMLTAEENETSWGLD